MGVNKEASGRKTVQVEIEVPGSPEEVWRAIATGPGISAWFVPTQVEEHLGGKVEFDLGIDMSSKGTVIGWEPPGKFVYEERDWLPGAPPVASEWTVQARSGGTCLVRVVHSLFASGEDWDKEMESFEVGWPGFFRVMRIYMTHFRGLGSAMCRVMLPTAESEARAWEVFAGSLGLLGGKVGERLGSSGDSPRLGGVIERVGDGNHPYEMVLRLDEPGPGVAAVGCFAWAGQVQVMCSIYYYGEGAQERAAGNETAWREWMGGKFPRGGGAGTCA